MQFGYNLYTGHCQYTGYCLYTGYYQGLCTDFGAEWEQRTRMRTRMRTITEQKIMMERTQELRKPVFWPMLLYVQQIETMRPTHEFIIHSTN